MAKKIKEVKIVSNIFDKPFDFTPAAGAGVNHFGGMMLSKRDEVIMPYSHRLDERALRKGLADYYNDFEERVKFDEKLKTIITTLLKSKPLKKEHGSGRGDVCHLVTKEYKDKVIPLHLINDLFTLFYNPMDRLDFENRLPDNLAKFKMIEKLNNPVLKVLTFHNPLKTMVIIRAMITHMMLKIVFGKYGTDPEDAQDMRDLLEQLGHKQNPAPAQTGAPCNAQKNPGQSQQGNQPGQQGNTPAQSSTPTNGTDPQDAPAQAPSVQNQQLSENFSNGSSPQQPAPQSSPAPGQPDPNAAPDPNAPNTPQAPIQQPNPATDPLSTPTDPFDLTAPNDPSVTQLEDEQPGQGNAGDYNLQQGAAGEDSSAGSGNSDVNGLDDQLNKIMTRMYDDRASKAVLEKLIDTARDTIESMEKIMGEDEMEATWEDISQDKLEVMAKVDPSKLKKIEDELKKLSLDMGGLKNKIKTLLDKSINFFSAKEIIKYENILETDDLGGLMDYELLHPRIRNMCIEDIMVKSSKKVGKIDAYVDISGSMDSSCGAQDDKGNTINRATLAKALTMKLKQMDMMDELFTFESSVHPTGNSLIDVLMMDGNGGTDLDNVVSVIAKRGKNSLIITDACDRVSTYSSKAFFIGVAGSNFGQFNEDVRAQYLKHDQLIIFDGRNILSVGANGQAIPKRG
jgi:hypothetical protein